MRLFAFSQNRIEIDGEVLRSVPRMFEQRRDQSRHIVNAGEPLGLDPVWQTSIELVATRPAQVAAKHQLIAVAVRRSA